MLAVLLGTALASGLIALWTPSTRRSESAFAGVPPTQGEVKTPQWTLVGADVTTNLIQKVFHHQILVTNEVTEGRSGPKHKITIPRRFFQTVTNAVDATIINLNGATNRFAHPLKLDAGREYWVVGPGTLDAVFDNSQGATIRLVSCKLVNRSEESLKDAGIRYILYKGTQLDFPMISRNFKDEKEFLVMSSSTLPKDDSAVHAGHGPDIGFVKIRYKITEKDLEDEVHREKQIIRTRLRQEMRDNPRLRESDIDWITF